MCVCKDIQHSKLVQWVCVCKDIQHARLVQWVCCLQRRSTFKTREMGETTKTLSIQNLCNGVRLKRHSTFNTVGSDVFASTDFMSFCVCGVDSHLQSIVHAKLQTTPRKQFHLFHSSSMRSKGSLFLTHTHRAKRGTNFCIHLLNSLNCT